MFLTRTSLIDIYAIIQATKEPEQSYFCRHNFIQTYFKKTTLLCLKKYDSLMVKKTKLFALPKFGSLQDSTSVSLKIGGILAIHRELVSEFF